jgi:hypothetical protein
MVQISRIIFYILKNLDIFDYVIYKQAKFYVAKNTKHLKLVFVCLWDKSLSTSEIDFL